LNHYNIYTSGFIKIFLGKDRDKLGMEWNLSLKQSKRHLQAF